MSRHSQADVQQYDEIIGTRRSDVYIIQVAIDRSVSSYEADRATVRTYLSHGEVRSSHVSPGGALIEKIIQETKHTMDLVVDHRYRIDAHAISHGIVRPGELIHHWLKSYTRGKWEDKIHMASDGARIQVYRMAFRGGCLPAPGGGIGLVYSQPVSLPIRPVALIEGSTYQPSLKRPLARIRQTWVIPAVTATAARQLSSGVSGALRHSITRDLSEGRSPRRHPF